jgi:hypothetical protein
MAPKGGPCHCKCGGKYHGMDSNQIYSRPGSGMMPKYNTRWGISVKGDEITKERVKHALEHETGNKDVEVPPNVEVYALNRRDFIEALDKMEKIPKSESMKLAEMESIAKEYDPESAKTILSSTAQQQSGKTSGHWWGWSGQKYLILIDKQGVSETPGVHATEDTLRHEIAEVYAHEHNLPNPHDRSMYEPNKIVVKNRKEALELIKKHPGSYIHGEE